MKTIKDPQLINITANVVVARPPLAKRQKGPKNLIKSEYICRIKKCPFQAEKAFMFCLPDNEQLRGVWTELCEMTKNQDDNTDRNCWVPRVCSYHFEKDDLELTSNGFRDLVANARPRLYLDGGGGGDDDGGQVAEQEEVVSPPSVKNAKVRLDENVDYVKQKREENKKILALAASRPLTIQAEFYSGSSIAKRKLQILKNTAHMTI